MKDRSTIVVDVSLKAKLDTIRGPGNPNNQSYNDVIWGLIKKKCG